MNAHMFANFAPRRTPFSSLTQALTSRALIRVFGILTNKTCIQQTRQATKGSEKESVPQLRYKFSKVTCTPLDFVEEDPFVLHFQQI